MNRSTIKDVSGTDFSVPGPSQWEAGSREENSRDARETAACAREATLTVDYSLTRRAVSLAVGSLLLAGCFSLLLVIGRLPVLSEWMNDPLLFKRCLVLHVDLALIVWFFAFAAGLFSLLPGDCDSHKAFRSGLTVACLGVAAMVVGTLIPRTMPILANYVPVIDNPVYVAGLILFFGGLTRCFFNGRLLVYTGRDGTAQSPGEEAGWRDAFKVTPDVAAGLKATAVAYLAAVTTFWISAAMTPRDLESKAYYELLFWGGGHVLQAANVAAMLTVWLLLLGSFIKTPVLTPSLARWLFGLLIAPHLLGPLLTAQGTLSPLYRLGFTRLMQFGLAPVVLVVMAICLRRLWRGWKDGSIQKSDLSDARFIGFVASAALTVTGFLLGAAIRNANTMIPAHYHASIGAVTVAYMAFTYLLLKPMGFPAPALRLRRLIPWQLYLFAAGQVIFAIGFAFGGIHGLGRKAYGAEQQLRSWGELLAIGVMSLGGFVAVAGGLLFLFLTVWFSRPQPSIPIFKLKPKVLARTTA